MADKSKHSKPGLRGQELKAFRSSVAKLKEKGIVSKRVDARKQAATKYMRSKVRKFEDVLAGRAIAVPAPRQIREKYTSAEIFPERGRFLIVPKEHERQRARIKKGKDLIEIITPLKWGEEREVVLPFKAKNMLELAERVGSDASIDDMKKPDEQFAFRLFGHNSRKAFVDRGEFADYVLRNYQHLFKGRPGQQAIKHLSVIRFKGYGEDVPAAPESDTPQEFPDYRKKRIDKKGRSSQRRMDTVMKLKLEKDRKRHEKARQKETPEQRKTRLEAQRLRSARNRQRKFYEDK